MIAGAGVVGVAVGFGAQTVVKDVISGVFYLLDDAFRIGEYIQSGSYKGTVESFSLRSVKLRHHRGPLFTVPFGELGAVQNMSRDWVIDKMMIGITYDSNLDTAKKLIKQIGKELAADPEFKPHIIEPLKMQGVEQFGDYAIQIRMKMMTKPGEQFVDPAQGPCHDQEGVRRQRHQVRLPDRAGGAGRRRRRGRAPGDGDPEGEDGAGGRLTLRARISPEVRDVVGLVDLDDGRGLALGRLAQQAGQVARLLQLHRLAAEAFANIWKSGVKMSTPIGWIWREIM